MIPDLAWGVVLVFEHVATLRDSRVGASAQFKLQVMETGVI